MTKQQLWQTVYIEAMKQGRMSKPKELADQAVKEFEERFEGESEYDLFKKVLFRFKGLKVNYTNEGSSDYVDITIRDSTFSFGFDNGKLVDIAT
jgi:hypothetical protein